MRSCPTLALLAACLCAGPATAQAHVFDLPAVLAPPLKPRTLKRTEKAGIVTEEVMFHAEKDGGKSVDIFAYFSYPKGAKKLPAFVWNQGGLAQASTYWTEFGARRGYATLCVDFPLPGYRSTGAYPIVSGLDLPADPRKAPIYHGAVALLRAVSYLESRPEVDKARIGMAGSSWGGFYTTLMAGLDPRLKACSAMFGSGGLHLGNLWWDGRGWDEKRDKAFRERWRTTLDPAWRLPRSKAAVAWFTGTNDVFYWLPAVTESHRRAAGPKHLTLLPNWDHALTPKADEQVFAWLDAHLKGGPAFLTVTPVEVVKDRGRALARWKFTGPRKAASAELILSSGDAGNWSSRCWVTRRAKVEGDTCTAELPGGPLPYFVSGAVLDADGFRYSTPLLRVVPGDLGIAKETAVDGDGCSEWGGFEDRQVNYLRLHGLPVPAPSPDAKEGKQSALLKAGRTALPPAFFTAGQKHRLRCWVKADRPATVTLELVGTFDGKPAGAKAAVKVGTAWQEVTLDFLPPRALAARLSPVITVPAGATLLVDGVRFRPAR